MVRGRKENLWREIRVRTQNKTILSNICLEKCKEGIVFLYGSLPLFMKSENIAKHLQVEIWLEIPLSKGNPKEYIR
jgi:hypothetical protein